MPTANPIPGLTIHYIDADEQRRLVILLLHGLGVTGESWQLQIPFLVNSGFRVLAPDVRGFGKSNFPNRPTSVTRMAQDMTGLLNCLAIDKAYVVGISMGGTIALQLALDEPERVRRLVLVNTFACLRPDRLGVWFYFALRYVLVHTLGLETQAQAVARHLFPRVEQGELRDQLIRQILQANPRGYRATMRALARFDVRSRLGEIKTPTLVVTGQEDRTVPPNLQSQLAAGISGARQVIIPNAGHAVSVEQPFLFNQVLLDFLKGI